MKHEPQEFARALDKLRPDPDGSERSGAQIAFSWTMASDSLTGLATRVQFQERLRQRLAQPDPALALLLVDVDHFKQINDGHGHPVGDQILQRLAERMRAGVRRGDMVARLGGDEFAVILEGLPDSRAFVTRAEALVARLCQPMKLAGHRLPCSVSAGLAIVDSHSALYKDLMINADAALYVAKAAGGGQLAIFDSELRAELNHRGAIEARARAAIQARQIFPYYQPKVDLCSGRIIGFEALMRWKAGDGSLESPGQCMRIMDDPNIARITIEQMLGRVLFDIRKWHQAGLAQPVSINLSDADLRRAGFAQWFLGRIAKAAVPIELIQVEISETVPLARNPAQIAAVLHDLNGAGVRIALDDFGTGNASLVHLRMFPVDELKIDRVFVMGLETEPDDRAIVSSVLALATSMAIEVVAEGIETERQREILLREGCRIGQGHLFGRPMPAHNTFRLLQSSPPPDAALGSSIWR